MSRPPRQRAIPRPSRSSRMRGTGTRGVTRRLLVLAATLGGLLLWTAAALTLYTGWDYLKVGIETVVDRNAP